MKIPTNAYEITYVDTNDSHHPDRVVGSRLTAQGRKTVKGGLKKQSIVVRADTQSKASVDFFAAHPMFKLLRILPVKAEVDSEALALLLTPRKMKPVKHPKQFDPRSVSGFQNYVVSHLELEATHEQDDKGTGRGGEECIAISEQVFS